MVSQVAGHLFELPTELVLEIASYLHPSQLVNIALTCSHLHRQVKAELRQHQKYHFASDLSPRVILKLLQPDSRCGAINSYVRHMEIWGSRRSWEDWSTWKVLQSGELQTVQESVLKSQVGPEEFIKYLELAKELWHIPVEDAMMARKELESGGDGFIKMLLFASYHHLQSLKFVKGEKYHTSLQWLTRAVGWSRLSGRWPPGFQSLRHVAVGVVDGHDLDKERVAGKAVDIAAILNLPNIERVYFNDLSQQEERREELESDQELLQDYHLPKASSSVQHIYLDSPRELTEGFREAFFNGPEKLKTIAIRGCNYYQAAGPQLDDTDMIVGDLLESYRHTLESLIFYNMHDGLHGYRCATYYAEQLEHWANSPGVLKLFSIDIEALELYGYDKSWTAAELIETVGPKENLMPASMEIIMLWGYDKLTHIRLEEGTHWHDILDEMATALIYNKKRLYKKLKVIYIDFAERQTSKQRSKLSFQKAIAAGWEAGVHVHTLTNRDDGEYWKRFPVAPDKYNLRTGPFGPRPSVWRINRFTGVWDDPGCEGCGECEQCLRVYPEQVWKSLGAA